MMFTARSATGVMIVVALDELFASDGSAVALLIVTVFATEGDAAAVGITLIVTVAVAPLVSVPRTAVTLPPDCDTGNPCVAVAETNVTPVGSTSLKVTPVASLGPWLVTLSV